MITTQIMSSSSLLILLLQFFLQTSVAKPYCTPSACGIIPNITSPLRLKGDPSHCGDRRLEFVCENNVTSFYLNSRKFYVQEINYTTATFRLVDASIDNHICSFPNYSTYIYNFRPALPQYLVYSYNARAINVMSCTRPLKNSSLFTEITHCQTSDYNSFKPRFTYIKLGSMKASELPATCGIDLIVMTSWKGFKDLNNVSLEDIHNSLLYGFQLAFCTTCGMPYTLWDKFIGFFFGPKVFFFIALAVGVFICSGVSLPVMIIIGLTCGLVLLFDSFQWIDGTTYTFGLRGHWPSTQPYSFNGFISIIIICVPRVIICPLVVWLLIYKFRRRHLSMFDAIESFLQSDNKLMPIRYTYSDIKKMTIGFQEKLGEGGYGSVYKGKLRSGHYVAVKLLGKSGANGQDFMNEIATIGRIHHINVIKLVGYCAEGSKRALVFDFMFNGSLEKYIFNLEKLNSLNWDTKFDIAIGVARGIEYLHRGCDVQILHFDIKPHNILLDDKFIPKISDFGLAKFCSTEKNTVTLTAARGTIGYVAPELINRSLGGVSYKADVYSFGMLLIEMLNLKRSLIGNNDDSSKYFPCWIYDCFNQGKDIEIGKAIENGDSNDDDRTRKLTRKMTIVALWCIQISPNDRPSMNKVLQMLEGDVEPLQLPEYPSQSSTQILINEDQSEITCLTDSVSVLHHGECSAERGESSSRVMSIRVLPSTC